MSKIAKPSTTGTYTNTMSIQRKGFKVTGRQMEKREEYRNQYRMLSDMMLLDLEDQQISFLDMLHDSHDPVNMNMALETFKHLLRKKENEEDHRD